jgi:hypothetical protein
MQKLAYIILLLCPLSLFGQRFRPLDEVSEEIAVIDMLPSAASVFDVSRFPGSHLGFPAAVLTGARSGEILAASIKTDSVRSIELTRSSDGGRSWTPEPPFNNSWDATAYRSLSLFNAGRLRAASRRERPKSGPGDNHLLLFSGGSPMLVSSSVTNGRYWSSFEPVNRFGGFRISGLTRLRDGRYLAVFHDDGRFLFDSGEQEDPPLHKSVIYRIYSSDGGLTWSKPEVALKHNLYGIYDAAIVADPTHGGNRLILICSERESRTAYIAYSTDNGLTWSYPEKLPPFLRGDRFGMARNGRELLISFRDMRPTLADGHPNPTYGDLVLWGGDPVDLLRGRHQGFKIRIADNFPTDEATDPADLRYSDCGYPSVLPLARREIAVIAYGRWDKDAPPFVRSYILHLYDIHQAMQELAKRR